MLLQDTLLTKGPAEPVQLDASEGRAPESGAPLMRVERWRRVMAVFMLVGFASLGIGWMAIEERALNDASRQQKSAAYPERRTSHGHDYYLSQREAYTEYVLIAVAVVCFSAAAAIRYLTKPSAG